MTIFQKTATGLSLVCAALALVLQLTGTHQSEKTAFVNLQEALNEFDYKKELEAQYTTTESARKTALDSLKLSIDLFYQQTLTKSKITNDDEKRLQLMQQQYQQKEKQLMQDNAALSQQYSEQVLKQFNQYIFDYGKKHNYKYVFGANNSGTLMYADDSEDITREVITYINNRYQGN